VETDKTGAASSTSDDSPDELPESVDRVSEYKELEAYFVVTNAGICRWIECSEFDELVDVTRLGGG
jgi:hypothetical protein